MAGPATPSSHASVVTGYAYNDTLPRMKITAVELRHRLGSVLDQLDRDQGPMIVWKGRQPRAVLLPLALYQERFPDFHEKDPRDALVREIRESAPPATRDTLTELRRCRYGDRA